MPATPELSEVDEIKSIISFLNLFILNKIFNQEMAIFRLIFMNFFNPNININVFSKNLILDRDCLS